MTELIEILKAEDIVKMENYKIQEEEDSIDLLEILGVLRQNLWIILLCTVVSAVIGFIAVSFFATPKYEASASMIVNSVQTDANSNFTSDMYNSSTKLAATYRVIIRSNSVLDEVKKDLGLDYSYDELKSMISVSSIDDTQVMRITVTSDNPNEAYRICAKVLEVSLKTVPTKVDAGSANAVDSASVGSEPVSPHVKRDTLIMGLLGAVLSIGVIIVVHLFDNKINTEADVTKYLDLTVLGVIPYYEKEKK